MQKVNDNSKHERLFQLLRLAIERPNVYTKKDLAEKLNISFSSIKRYFSELEYYGFKLVMGDNYCYRLEMDKQYEYLKDLLYFSEKDQQFIYEVLTESRQEGRQKERVLQKMNSIYDFTRLGNHLVSSQFLTKINLLEQAKNQKKVVALIDYRSTFSAKIETKHVEPFRIMPKEDVLHAFDIEQKVTKHYRISRIASVEIFKDLDWKFESQHKHMPTDPFRVSNDQQAHVKIKMTVGGYNEITERFPDTVKFLERVVGEKDTYLLECDVNFEYRGLTNFLLGNYHHVVEIYEPDSLIEHLEKEVEKIKQKFF